MKSSCAETVTLGVEVDSGSKKNKYFVKEIIWGKNKLGPKNSEFKKSFYPKFFFGYE